MAKTTKKQEVKKEEGMNEVRKRHMDLKQELFKLELDHSQFKLKNTRSIFNTKKDIARVMTIIREKELSNENN